MEEWKPEEIAAHLDYYKALNEELVESGELVRTEVLAGPDQPDQYRISRRPSRPTDRQPTKDKPQRHKDTKTRRRQRCTRFLPV